MPDPRRAQRRGERDDRAANLLTRARAPRDRRIGARHVEVAYGVPAERSRARRTATLPRTFTGSALSLGGCLAALAGLTDDLAFVVPLVPPVYLYALACSLVALDGPAAARGSPTTSPPLPLERLRSGYAVHCPLTYPLAVRRERVLIIGARGDRLVAPEHAYALLAALGRARDLLVQRQSHRSLPAGPHAGARAAAPRRPGSRRVTRRLTHVRPAQQHSSRAANRGAGNRAA